MEMVMHVVLGSLGPGGRGEVRPLLFDSEHSLVVVVVVVVIVLVRLVHEFVGKHVLLGVLVLVVVVVMLTLLLDDWLLNV